MAILRREVSSQTPWPDKSGPKAFKNQLGWRQTGLGITQTKALQYTMKTRKCVFTQVSRAPAPGLAIVDSHFNPLSPVNLYLNTTMPNFRKLMTPLQNRAVTRFQEQLGENAELGAALATVPESFRMIAERSASCLNAYRALKKGRFKDFTKVLNVRPRPRHKTTVFTRPKDASALWLEYWFGWAPLLQDIFAASYIVCGQFPPVKVVGTASIPFASKWTKKSAKDIEIEENFGKMMAKAQASVTVSNPNLYLLQTLGLLNPASIAWELIPFSFMADWFGNIGDVINDWTAYAGLALTDPFITLTVKGVCRREEDYASTRYGQYVSLHKFARVERILEVPKHRLHFEIPGAPSATRAATAASLASLIFGKG